MILSSSATMIHLKLTIRGTAPHIIQNCDDNTFLIVKAIRLYANKAEDLIIMTSNEII